MPPATITGAFMEKIQFTRQSKDHRQRRQQHDKRDPTAVQPISAAGQPERSHGIALHHRGMTADSAHRSPKISARLAFQPKLSPNSAIEPAYAGRPWKAAGSAQ